MSDAPPDATPPDDPLAAIEASRLGPAQKKALRLLAEGESYREAARQAGLRSPADLKRHAQRFGLVEAHNRARRAVVAQEREMRTADLIESMRQVAGKGTRELLRRLDEEPESIATRDLTVGVGIALDKIAKYERWEDGSNWGSQEHQSGLAEILDALGERGRTVEIAARVTVGNGGAGGERQSAPPLLQRPGSGSTEVARCTDGVGPANAMGQAIDVRPVEDR